MKRRLVKKIAACCAGWIIKPPLGWCGHRESTRYRCWDGKMLADKRGRPIQVDSQLARIARQAGMDDFNG